MLLFNLPLTLIGADVSLLAMHVPRRERAKTRMRITEHAHYPVKDKPPMGEVPLHPECIRTLSYGSSLFLLCRSDPRTAAMVGEGINMSQEPPISCTHMLIIDGLLDPQLAQ